MYWFELIGLSLGFAGSVLFSAGLIKTPEQIRDENQTYFDKNFFTYEAEMASRKLLIAAFLLMIAGFAVSAAGVIAEELFKEQQLLIGILLSVTLLAAGFLATALFYIRRVNAHRQLKYGYVKGLFRNTVQTYLDKWDALEKFQFDDEKAAVQGALRERFSRLDPEDNEAESRLLTRIDAVKKAHLLKEISRQYLDDARVDD